MKHGIILAVFSVFLVHSSLSPAKTQPPSIPADPQIVRISYLEGDVRIARGAEYERPKGATWEKAVANLPLETGFTLVTGVGRAEIEFEDVSTLYLGENSVLTFNDLHTTGGVPQTEVALLSGTVTLHVQPYVPGETFTLKTPTGDVTADYPQKTYLRISSFMDGFTIKAEKDAILDLPGGLQRAVASGQAMTYSKGGVSVDSSDADAFAEWDKWVAGRIAQRSQAMAQAMKASGLTEPIPGLAEMNGQGRFFACPPYGTCWEPGTEDDRQQPGESSYESAPSPPAQVSQQPAKATPTANTKRPQTLQHNVESSVSFGCLPYPYSDLTIRTSTERIEVDPKTGKTKKVVDTGVESYPLQSSNWAVCHAGSWIYHRNHYTWVVGRQRHHHHPGHWIKCGHSVGFVPIHPLDVKGQPPINRKHDVFAVRDKNGRSFERIKFDEGRPIEVLDSPPKEFRSEHLSPLAAADEPRMEAHHVKEAFSGNKGALAVATGIPLTFDHHSQSILMPRLITLGNKSITLMEPVNNHGGNLQARTGGASSEVGYRGGGNYAGGGSRSGSGGGSCSRNGGNSGGSGSSGSRGGGGSGGGSSAGGGSSNSGSGGSHGGSSSSGGASSSGASSSSTPTSSGSRR